jgi:hypothetical protein
MHWNLLNKLRTTFCTNMLNKFESGYSVALLFRMCSRSWEKYAVQTRINSSQDTVSLYCYNMFNKLESENCCSVFLTFSLSLLLIFRIILYSDEVLSVMLTEEVQKSICSQDGWIYYVTKQSSLLQVIQCCHGNEMKDVTTGLSCNSVTEDNFVENLVK